MNETTKNATFVIGDAMPLSEVSKGSKGDYPLEHSAMKAQISAQLTDGKITKNARAGIFATAKYNVNTLVNSLKKTYYGSIEDGAGYVSVTKTSGADADIKGLSAEWQKALNGIKSNYNFEKKDVKNLIFIVELRPKTTN